MSWKIKYYNIYIYAFSRRFYPKRLTLHSSYSYLLSLGIEPMILTFASAMLYQLSYRKVINWISTSSVGCLRTWISQQVGWAVTSWAFLTALNEKQAFCEAIINYCFWVNTSSCASTNRLTYWGFISCLNSSLLLKAKHSDMHVYYLFNILQEFIAF